jgi:hypothetical protein
MAHLEPDYDGDDLEHERDDDGGDVPTEDRARAMGWKPLPEDPYNIQPHEYRGDPRRWTSAEEFVRKGEAELPILRDQNRRMSERLARMEPEMTTLRRSVDEQKVAVQAALALAKRADDQGYQRAKRELEGQRREAVEAGDTVAFDQVQEQIEALEAGRVEAAPPAATEPPPDPAPRAAPGTPQPEIAAFVRENPWFNDAKRPYLQASMIAFHKEVITESPAMALADQLDEALVRMQDKFPEIIPVDEEEPMAREPAPPRRQPVRRAAPSSLAPTGGGGPPRRQTASPIDGIADADERKEARAAYESIRRADPGYTEKEYMAVYNDPHADPLELRAQRK